MNLTKTLLVRPGRKVRLAALDPEHTGGVKKDEAEELLTRNSEPWGSTMTNMSIMASKVCSLNQSWGVSSLVMSMSAVSSRLRATKRTSMSFLSVVAR
jgi:hypothetical protein